MTRRAEARAPADKGVDPQQRQQLINGKVVKDKDEHQRRQVADQLHIAATHQPPKEALADAGEGYRQANNRGQQCGPHRELERGEQPLDEIVGHQPAGLGVPAKQVLRDGSPVAFVL